MQRDSIRNKRLDCRTSAGIVAGAKAAQLFDSFCPAQSSPVDAEIDDNGLTIAERNTLVEYRRQLFATTGKVFTGGDENYLTILGKIA